MALRVPWILASVVLAVGACSRCSSSTGTSDAGPPPSPFPTTCASSPPQEALSDAALAGIHLPFVDSDTAFEERGVPVVLRRDAVSLGIPLRPAVRPATRPYGPEAQPDLVAAVPKGERTATLYVDRETP